jgi:4-hydroxybenzoate polyprenyltransferase
MAALQLLITLLLIVIGQFQQLGLFYYAGVTVASALSIYQQKLIFHREKALCFKAFLNSNYFGMAIFVGLVLDYLAR